MEKSRRSGLTKADHTKARVQDAAAKVFRQRGYIGTRLSDIAAEAGLQAGSLYYHFASREALAEEVLKVGTAKTTEIVRQRLAALPADARPIDRLREAIVAQSAAVLEAGDYTSATIRLLPQVPEAMQRQNLAALDLYLVEWDRLLADACAAGEIRGDVDLRVVRNLIMGALNSAAEWYRPTRRLSGEEIARQVADLFLAGFAPPARRSRQAATAVDLGTGIPTDDWHTGTDEWLTGTRPSAEGSARRAATRKRVLDAAAQTFRANGYSGTRLSDIAAAAGLRTASLYHYFPSREALVLDLMEEAWFYTDRYVRRCVEHAGPDASASEQLAVAIAAHLVSALHHETLTAAVIEIMGQVPEEVRRVSLTDQRKYLQLWREILQRAVADGELRSDLDVPAMLMMVMGSMNWTVTWFSGCASLRPVDVGAVLMTVMVDGLAAG